MAKPQMFLNAVISLKSRTAEEHFPEISHIIVFLAPGKTTHATGEWGRARRGVGSRWGRGLRLYTLNKIVFFKEAGRGRQAGGCGI